VSIIGDGAAHRFGLWVAGALHRSLDAHDHMFRFTAAVYNLIWFLRRLVTGWVRPKMPQGRISGFRAPRNR
jgi:hypothetical protein